MRFRELELAGAFLIEPERHEDARGFFARTFDLDELVVRGLDATIVQESIAWNVRAGTVRGMHLQLPPAGEVKLVRCTRGAVHDVIVDVRPESTTFGHSVAVRLDDEQRSVLYVPQRFAHGYQVLRDDTELTYSMTARYAPEAATGIRHDDPGLGIEWPLPVSEISPRDLEWPVLAELPDEVVTRLRTPGQEPHDGP